MSSVFHKLLLGTLTSLALGVPASAHHSFAPEFDASKPAKGFALDIPMCAEPRPWLVAVLAWRAPRA